MSATKSPDTVTVTLTRDQAETLLKAAQYVWSRVGDRDAVPSWRVFHDAIERLQAALAELEARP